MNNITAGSALRRQDEILRIVRQQPVRSQEELQALLKRRGFAVAQPTLSRDLKQLGLLKAAAGYVTPADAAGPGEGAGPAETAAERLQRTLKEFVLSARAAGSLVILRTPPADAQPVARAIDVASLEGVVGTLGGDDTIFLATGSPAAATALCRRLLALIAPSPGRRRVRA